MFCHQYLTERVLVGLKDLYCDSSFNSCSSNKCLIPLPQSYSVLFIHVGGVTMLTPCYFLIAALQHVKLICCF